MIPLSSAEIQKLALELKTSEGDHLQEIRIHQNLIALGFYSTQLYWLVVDLNPVSPQIVRLEDLARIGFKAEKKPVQQYLKAHFMGRRLSNVSANTQLGRVIEFKFDLDKSIEIRLFPKGQNFIIHSGKTKVSFLKPKELKISQDPAPLNIEPNYTNKEDSSESLLQNKSLQWLRERTGGEKISSDSVTKVAVDTHKQQLQQKKINKIKIAIQKIVEDTEKKENLRYQACGEWLKENQTLNVPDEYTSYIDLKMSFGANLENCFKKSKELKLKISGAKSRIQVLEAEMRKIEMEAQNPPSLESNNEITITHSISSLKNAGAKGRTFQLESGVVLYVGKSAEDNLRLLRKAKPWHYWLHLRDRPSCHGLVERNKSQVLSDAALHLAAHHLISNNFGDKQKNYFGDKFDIIVAECRFVRPIKGDRHGRVHYSDERSFTHLFKG